MKAILFPLALALSACAAFPELDGKPVGPERAAAFQVSAPQVWALDFGDAGLKRMLAEADAQGLDAASARARFRAADLALAQAGRAGGLQPSAQASAAPGRLAVTGGLSFEPDLFGRFEAALSAAQLEHQAAGLDLLIARRTLALEVVRGWVALAEARTAQSRLAGDIATEERALGFARARHVAGETTAADLTLRSQTLTRLRAQSAQAQGAVALAEARLRALGAVTLPGKTTLKAARRPALPARTDLSATAATPAVCAAFTRFRAADATRAEALAASRPRLVLTSSLEATAKTLAGLISGNGLAVANSVRVEGALLDNGASRARVDTARLGVAQAEIGWLQARSQAEIAALEAMTAAQGAEAALAASLEAHAAASFDRDRARSRHGAGLSDGVDLAEADRAVAAAQRAVDQARADAFRAAAALHAALPPPVAGCAGQG